MGVHGGQHVGDGSRLREGRELDGKSTKSSARNAFVSRSAASITHGSEPFRGRKNIRKKKSICHLRRWAEDRYVNGCDDSFFTDVWQHTGSTSRGFQSTHK